MQSSDEENSIAPRGYRGRSVRQSFGLPKLPHEATIPMEFDLPEPSRVPEPSEQVVEDSLMNEPPKPRLSMAEKPKKRRSPSYFVVSRSPVMSDVEDES